MPAQRDPSARRRYRRAVLGGGPPSPPAPPAPPLRVLTGTVLDASPHVLVLATAAGEARLPMTPTTAVWHGGRRGPAALRPGRQALVRMDAGGLAADRVWVDIGRVTGTLLSARPDALEVDLGPHRGRARVALDARSLRLVQVRHPRLEPGYLVDVLCVRSPDGPRAVAPATSQPGHRADDLASPAPDALVPAETQGTATWYGWPGTPQSTGMADNTTFPPEPGQAPEAVRGPATTRGRPLIDHGPWTGQGSLTRHRPRKGQPPAAPRNPQSGQGASSGQGTWTGQGPNLGQDAWTGQGAGAGPGAWSGQGANPDRDAWAGQGSGQGRDGWTGRGSGSGREAWTGQGSGAGWDARSGQGARGGQGGELGGGPPGYAVAYPAVDGEGAAGGCTEAPPGCVPLPLLSVGSGLEMVNDCSGRGAEAVVAECGCVAARFCDRCVECGTSPRGRIAELGPVAFAALGGDLDAGCFNVTVRWAAETREGRAW
ncbi:hypothetical protein [Actinomadura rupiterrae]|uniref:hypothetical protein n=1 Tax=Actinomadura rupiterrae TaxID=559627 RepID=UPI0020A308A5|nr:hypothetical protein [Actinomadura rupiterrae]MCP2338005.1 hypothetical protein [Actinomadura rupiterrae]